MPVPHATFGLTPAELHHQLGLGHKLGMLLRRLLGLTPDTALPVSTAASA